MFDIGATELLLIVIVAVVVIGPKDLPLAMRTAGRWIGKIRRVSSHFRSGLDAMVREAEMEEMEKKWAEQNKKIMAQHPPGAPEPERSGAYPAEPPPAAPQVKADPTPQAGAEARGEPAAEDEPQLPLDRRD